MEASGLHLHPPGFCRPQASDALRVKAGLGRVLAHLRSPAPAPPPARKPLAKPEQEVPLHLGIR